MEYVFGTVKRKGIDIENLKTVGEEHTDLSGRCIIKRVYPDREVEDIFTIEDHYGSGEDSEGTCYDWYLIKDHYRDTDRFMPQKGEIEERAKRDEQDLTDIEIDNIDLWRTITDMEIEIMDLQDKEE